MWECGLKHLKVLVICNRIKSLLMWECGLKPEACRQKPEDLVTPYVGVWIETNSDTRASFCARRHSLCGSVD